MRVPRLVYFSLRDFYIRNIRAQVKLEFISSFGMNPPSGGRIPHLIYIVNESVLPDSILDNVH